MFWVTLRQAVQEWRQRRQNAMAPGLALEIVDNSHEQGEPSEYMRAKHRLREFLALENTLCSVGRQLEWVSDWLSIFLLPGNVYNGLPFQTTNQTLIRL